MLLSGRRLTASRGLVVELRLEVFTSLWARSDGETRGYRVVAEDGRPWRDDDLDEVGVHVLGVVGTTHRSDAVQADGFQPGEPVILMPEPDNAFDPWALGVLDVRLGAQAGYVSATRSRALVEEMVHRPLHALVLVEHRAQSRRVGLRVAASFAPLLASPDEPTSEVC